VIVWLRSVRGLTVLLVASLALNLFLAGVLVGRFTGQLAQDSETRRVIQAMLAPLPEAKRELMRKEFGDAMPRVREQFAALQRARAALAQEIVKPVPDSAALEQGFATVQAHSTAIGAELQKAMIRGLPALTQEERRSMVEALARRRSGSALPSP
jgi:uncharacterized membrane protein